MNILLGQCKRQTDDHLLDDNWFTSSLSIKSPNDIAQDLQDLSFHQENLQEHKFIINNPYYFSHDNYTITNTQDFLEYLEKINFSVTELNKIINVLQVRFAIYQEIKKNLDETKHSLHIFQVQLAIVRELLKNCETSPSEYLIELKQISQLGKKYTVHANIASQVNQMMISQIFDYHQQNLFPRMLQLQQYTKGNTQKLHTQLLFEVRVTGSEFCAITKVFGSAIDKSHDDIMCFNKSHEKWEKIMKVYTSKCLGDVKQIQKSYNDFTKSIKIGHALIFKRNNYKSEFMRKSIFLLGAMWYFVQNEKTRQRAIAHTSILQPQSASDIMNLLELSGIKHVMKLGNQFIATNRKIYIDSVVNPFTKEYISKEQREGTLNKITQIPLQFVNLDIHESDDGKQDLYKKTNQKIRIRVLCHEKLQEPLKDQPQHEDYLKDGFISQIKSWMGLGIMKQKIFDTILIHIHGGGFIAMSSGSHQCYTRQWANKLQIPVFSIDYSLAPKHQYPTAVDDCWQAYQWILTYVHKHFNIIPKKIILAGDSAGANLCSVITGLAIKYGCQVPDGLFLAYPIMDTQVTYSPNCMKALQDAVLSHTVIEICGNSYIGDYDPEGDPFISPHFFSDEILQRFPPVRLVCGQNDPILDQSYLFADKLINNGVDVQIVEYQELPHGFLHFSSLNGMKEAVQCISDSIDLLNGLIHKSE